MRRLLAALCLSSSVATAAGAATSQLEPGQQLPDELCEDVATEADPEACPGSVEPFLLQMALQVHSEPDGEAHAALFSTLTISTLTNFTPTSKALAVYSSVGLGEAALFLDSGNTEEEKVMVRKNLSKRIVLILEMVPLTAIFGLDRLYLCNCEIPIARDNTNGHKGKISNNCFLGLAKFILCGYSLLSISTMMPFCVLWWFMDGALIIDNALRCDDSIDALGMVAWFDKSTVADSKKLGFFAAGQFALELAFFLPAILAISLGIESRGLLQNMLTRLRSQPMGASPTVIDNATSTVLYQAGSTGHSEDNVCSICCDAFQESDCLRVLPCRHKFHADCVDRWLTRNSTCPLCKGDITNEGQPSTLWSRIWRY